MGRARREVYIHILKALAYRGPLKLTRITYVAHVNYSVLQEHLGFLTKHNLVEERTAGKKRVVYVLTKSGRSGVETFGELARAVTSKKSPPSTKAHSLTKRETG